VANPAAIISGVIENKDDVDPNDGDNVRRRAKLLNFLQQVNDYVHLFLPWEWTYKEGLVVVPNNQSSFDLDLLVDDDDAPDFLEFGYHGAIFDQSRNLRMVEKSRYVFSTMKNTGQGNQQFPFFAIWGGAVRFLYSMNGNTTFIPFYRVRPQVLADDATELLIPDKYVATVVIPGLVAKTQEDKDDARQTWFAQFQQGLSRMAATENPMKTGPMKRPVAIRGAW